MRLALLASLPLLSTVLVGCPDDAGSGGDDLSNEACVPGATLACNCEDGSPGARSCEPDGVGYGPCTCDGSPPPPTTGSPDDTGPGGADTDDPLPGTTTGDPWADGTETEAPIPDFQNDIVPIFYSACGAPSTACHAQNAYFANVGEGCRGWLSLEDQPLGSVFDDLDPMTNMESEGPTGCPDRTLHQRLMELAPWECDANSAYVTPGSLEDSYIWVKLTDGQTCGDFRVMPPPEEGFEINAYQIQTLRAWILAGAPE